MKSCAIQFIANIHCLPDDMPQITTRYNLQVVVFVLLCCFFFFLVFWVFLSALCSSVGKKHTLEFSYYFQVDVSHISHLQFKLQLLKTVRGILFTSCNSARVKGNL